MWSRFLVFEFAVHAQYNVLSVPDTAQDQTLAYDIRMSLRGTVSYRGSTLHNQTQASELYDLSATYARNAVPQCI